jgi:hypothetical protein
VVTPLIWAFLLFAAAAPGSASARGYLPAPGTLFQGEAGLPASSYERAVGKHPAVYEEFSAWGEYLPAIFKNAADAQARLMIHITTASGTRELITPQGIADGQGDAWLTSLGRAIAASGQVVYIRLMAEMDGYWNPYSAFNANWVLTRERAFDRSLQARLEAGHADPPRRLPTEAGRRARAAGDAEAPCERRSTPRQGRDALGPTGRRRAVDRGQPAAGVLAGGAVGRLDRDRLL